MTPPPGPPSLPLRASATPPASPLPLHTSASRLAFPLRRSETPPLPSLLPCASVVPPPVFTASSGSGAPLRAVSPVLASDEDEDEDEDEDNRPLLSRVPIPDFAGRATTGGKAPRATTGGKAPRPTTGGKGQMSYRATARHRKNNKTGNIRVVSKPAQRRLARRGGVKRLEGLVYEEIRDVAKEFLVEVLKKSCIYLEDRTKNKGKTLNPSDVVRGLQNMGFTMYGYHN